jgi:hypothetical protein
VTATDLLTGLLARGVRFDIHGDRLRVDAPVGCLTDQDREVLKVYRAELLELLRQQDAGWREEWLFERDLLHRRLDGCHYADVLDLLRPLADAEPTTLAEWVALGEQLFQTETDLRRQGRLPPARDPYEVAERLAIQSEPDMRSEPHEEETV